MPYYPPPNLRYQFAPPDRALLAESVPAFGQSSGTIMPTGGRLEFIKVRLAAPASVTNVILYLTVAGATLTAAQNFAALYTEARVLVGVSADQASAWATGAPKVVTMPLASGPFVCPAGNYYVAFYSVGSTLPTWGRAGALSATQANVGSAAQTLMVGSADTGLTTAMPATMGAQSAGGTVWYAALS